MMMAPTQEKQQLPPEVDALPFVSIVIPMLNEVRNIARCLDSILAQTYPQNRLEIVVVDGISDDGSQALVNSYSLNHRNIRLLNNPLKITPRSLNIGIQEARGDVVIILGAHTTIKSDFIELNVGYMRDRGEVCTGGTQINVGENYWQQAVGLAMGSRFGIPTAPYRFEKGERYVDTVVYAAYRKELLAEIGLFDDELLISEDAELNWRIRKKGFKIFFSPKIVSYYYPRSTLPTLFKQFFSYGMMRVNVIKKHRDAFKLLHILPSLAILGGLACLFAGFFVTSFWWALLAGSTSYALLVSVGALQNARQSGWRFLPALPFCLMTMHIGFAVGFIFGVFKTHKWGVAFPRWMEKALAISCDYVALNAAFFWWAHLRSELGMFSLAQQPLVGFFISNIVFAFWFLFFLFLGLYGPWNANSRLDELMAVIKTVGLGVLAIFLLTFDIERDLDNPLPGSRMLLVSYWLIVSACVGFMRLSLRTGQRKLLSMGIGLRRTLIIGWGPTGRELFDKITRFPALGYRILGFIQTQAENSQHAEHRGVPLLGPLNMLSSIIAAERVEEVLIALDEEDNSSLMQIIAQTDGAPVLLKIVPDLYSIITGQARTNQIYGVPLIEILPQYMPAWERRFKRAIDIGVSLVILIAGLPLWLLVALAIRLDTPGPMFYRQQRVGRNGKVFVMVKFRSMMHGAEKLTGPVWAEKDDPRVTGVGRVIRKLRIDEVPQFANVLRGEMSLVGPRPERPVFVEQLKQQIPLYSRRLKVQPGITGWAQIKGGYDQSIDDVKQKLQYDLFYLENMSLRMDFKILLHTAYVMLAGRGL